MVQRIPDYAEEETEWFEAQIEDLDPKNSDSFRWKVSALRPFTTYHFKIVLNFSSDLQGIETQPSLPIRTKADPDVAPSKPILYEIEQVKKYDFFQNDFLHLLPVTCVKEFSHDVDARYSIYFLYGSSQFYFFLFFFLFFRSTI